MTPARAFRRTVRRLLQDAGYRITRIPAPQAPSPGAIEVQSVIPAGSHVAALAAAVMQTAGEGPVLECGSGDHSTPLLHLLCRDRLLVSADSNRDWLARFEKFRSDRHQFEYVENWRRWRGIEERQWAVAFVDCSPSEDRVDLLDRLQGRATFVVVHDTETDEDAARVYAFESVLNRFKYRSDYRIFRPYTSIVSDVRPFEMTAAESVDGMETARAR